MHGILISKRIQFKQSNQKNKFNFQTSLFEVFLQYE